jgi:hypothetical protein
MGIATFNFDASVFAQFFSQPYVRRRNSARFAGLHRPRDVGRGLGSGKAFVRRQGAEIHSTEPLWQMRRQCAFDSALARSGQRGRLRNSRLRMLRLRTPNAPHGERLTCRVRFLVSSAPTIVSQAAHGCVGFAKPPLTFYAEQFVGRLSTKTWRSGALQANKLKDAHRRGSQEGLFRK